MQKFSRLTLISGYLFRQFSTATLLLLGLVKMEILALLSTGNAYLSLVFGTAAQQRKFVSLHRHEHFCEWQVLLKSLEITGIKPRTSHSHAYHGGDRDPRDVNVKIGRAAQHRGIVCASNPAVTGLNLGTAYFL